MEFFSSDIGVAIAWICGVLGFVFSFFQSKVNRQLRLEVNNSRDIIQSYESSSSNVSTSDNSSNNKVRQVGEKNIVTGNVSGGMRIDM